MTRQLQQESREAHREWKCNRLREIVVVVGGVDPRDFVPGPQYSSKNIARTSQFLVAAKMPGELEVTTESLSQDYIFEFQHNL
jgi:hypothetical protein